MEKILTDDTLTQEQAKIVARRASGAMKAAARQVPSTAESAARAGKEMLDPALDRASGIANQALEQAAAVVRNVGGQATAASDALYQQSARAGQYVTRNVNQYPLPALLIAGAIGFLAAYLMQTARNRAV
jgi:ElaB/YqjD/DUF883 family membrane-anchored ribosome-binding protein